LSCPKPGPDILLEHEGNRVWIEAVEATNGVPGLTDTVIEPNPDGSGRIPEEKLVLRYTNAITEKYRKYRGYLREGIIHAISRDISFAEVRIVERVGQLTNI
jgi:type I restriction enzyme S subunit